MHTNVSNNKQAIIKTTISILILIQPNNAAVDIIINVWSYMVLLYAYLYGDAIKIIYMWPVVVSAAPM